MSLCTFESGAVGGRRTGIQNGRLTLVLPVRGEVTVEQNARRATAAVGDLVLVDGRRPYRLAMSAPVTFAALQADRHLLGLLDSTTHHLTATQWSATGGLLALSTDMFTSLAGNLAEIDGAECETLGLTVTSLMTGLFIDRLRTAAADPAVARQILLLRILTHIRALLGDATLTPRRVANDLEISLRYVQSLFAELGTSPAKWIRDERLARLHADLLTPRFDNQTVAALGESWGLTGASQVSRLFRARYGHTPSEVRGKRSGRSTAQEPQRVSVSTSEFGLEHLGIPDPGTRARIRQRTCAD
jgi:AraC-like DNA-binding protein